MVASKEFSFSADGREVSICACQKAFMHLHLLHFFWDWPHWHMHVGAAPLQLD